MLFDKSSSIYCINTSQASLTEFSKKRGHLTIGDRGALRPCETFNMMELFTKIVKGWNYFSKKLYLRCLTWSGIRFWKKRRNPLSIVNKMTCQSCSNSSLNLDYICVSVFPSIHRKGFICLEQLECQGTDQRCCVEEVSFLRQVPPSLL